MQSRSDSNPRRGFGNKEDNKVRIHVYDAFLVTMASYLENLLQIGHDYIHFPCVMARYHGILIPVGGTPRYSIRSLA